MSANFQNEKFEQYFSQTYSSRWSDLFKALTSKDFQILRLNKFANYSDINQFQKIVFGHAHIDSFEQCFLVHSDLNVHNLVDENSIHVFYKMDPASYIVARALDVQHEDIVLDLCAAPGGKSLVLAEALNGTGQLISNEYSNARRERLTRVIKEYVPFEIRQNIFVQGKDGNAFGLHYKETFDRILADVPCSGERHLLENSQEFSEWTKRRSENLAIRQYSLLSSAYLACKKQGRIVYSTCSISPLENDHVVAKLVKKKDVKLVRPDWIDQIAFVEKTDFGYCILPDTKVGDVSGLGPMYFSVIEKIS